MHLDDVSFGRIQKKKTRNERRAMYSQFELCPIVTLSTSEIEAIAQLDSKPVEIAFTEMHSNVRILFDVIFPYLSQHHQPFMKTRELRTTPNSLIVSCLYYNGGLFYSGASQSSVSLRLYQIPSPSPCEINSLRKSSNNGMINRPLSV